MDAVALTEAMNLADAASTVREAAAALRTRFDSLRIVVVDAFDMRHETPAATGTARQLFLAASDGHCWTVTGDATLARGLFVTDRA